ncbi:hypothetical protein M513_13409 [Trichuris suis]|uniref:Uncharacterized protein n=1 Tax=Trichuris suis TaxID=68888 RepID=A0A085LL58_9BILA|nr:hypothetical protein M513_13409 [Trichuris suis]
MGCRWNQFLKCFLLNLELVTVKTEETISAEQLTQAVLTADLQQHPWDRLLFSRLPKMFRGGNVKRSHTKMPRSHSHRSIQPSISSKLCGVDYHLLNSCPPGVLVLPTSFP